MLGIVLVLDGVTGILALEIDLVLLHVSVEDVIGAHAEDLGEGDQEVEQVDHLDAGVLLVELLVLGPPFPRHAVGQLGHFLRHRAGVIEHPFRLRLLVHRGGIHANAQIQGRLHAEEFVQFVGGRGRGGAAHRGRG